MLKTYGQVIRENINMQNARVKKGDEFYKKDRKNIFIIIQNKVLFE